MALWALALTWDLTAWDFPAMQALGTETGFPLRHNFWLEVVLHDGARQATRLLILGVLALSLRPLAQRVAPGLALPWWALVGLLVCLFTVGLIKRYSATSCPWELATFDGVATYVSHWNWGLRDGGAGRCFPGGHASAAFAFWPVALAWMHSTAPRTQRLGRWLWWIVLVLGVLLGVVQTLRGAHYPSHTLWTAALCWTLTVMVVGLGCKLPSSIRTKKQLGANASEPSVGGIVVITRVPVLLDRE